MTPAEIIAAIAALSPAAIKVVDAALHAILNASTGAETEEQAVEAQRAASRAAIDLLEQAEK